MRAAGLAALVLGVLATDAVANGREPEPIQLEYRPIEGCPSHDELWRRIESRTAHVRRASSSDGVREFLIVITPSDDGVVWGVLRVRDVDGTYTVRRLDASTCDDLVLALALTTALAVDERAMAPVAPPVVAAPPATAPATRPATHLDRGPAWRGAAGAFVIGLVGPAPDWMVTVPLFVELEAARWRGRPSVRLDLLYATGGAGDREGLASFSWGAARIELCPLSLRLSARLRATPCGVVEAGFLGARGMAVPDARSSTRPWVAAGAVARLSVTVAGDAALEAQVGAVTPFIRDTYTIDVDVVHAIPRISAWAGVGLAVHFP